VIDTEWKKDNANSETEISIKIVSEEFDPPLNGTIKKIEITYHRPKQRQRNSSINLRKLLSFKH
jgi:hypothetical protein